MIRFAWLQARGQTLVGAGALAALAVATAIVGVHLSHLHSSLVSGCQQHGDCGIAVSEFLSHGNFFEHVLDIVAQVAAPLLGVFWGAPLLARELESGTHRLVWTQSVTRSRWLITRLAIVGLATAMLAGLLTLAITWFYRDIDPLASNRYAVFDARDVVPIGYAVFAFALGVLLGAIIRRTVPAMAATIVGYVGARVAITLWVRPHLLTPVHKAMGLLSGGFGFEIMNGSARMVAKGAPPSNAWRLSSHIVTSSGHVASSSQLSAFLQQHCAKLTTLPPPTVTGRVAKQGGNPAIFQACGNRAARVFHLLVTYQPANHYWPLQWLEVGIFVALALLAAAGAYWWVTRRIA